MRIKSRPLLAAVAGLGTLSSQVFGFLPGVGSDAFLPNLGLDIAAPNTISHADQTSQGIIGFLEEHFGSNASFGFPPGLFRRRLPGGVRSARKTIIAANEGVDQDFSYNFERFREKDYGPAHFDNEYLEEGQNHLLKLRSEMIAILQSDWTYQGTNAARLPYPVEKARVWLGRQLHTLQDFYAHSNWVEMGRTTISPVVGRPGAVIYPKTPLNEPTCTEYCINPDSLSAAARPLYLAMHTCYRNCFVGDQYNSQVALGRACAVTCAEPDSFCRVSDECQGHACSNNTIELGRVTTGYYRTEGDPNSVKPGGKCSHGGLSDAGARGIEGINKDSTLQTYSPHWFLHRTAATLAIAHTRQYLADLLQDWPTVTIGNASYPQPKLSERHVRLLFGLNPGSIAFVVDRSRSMATSLPAVKGAVRAVVTRLQNTGYLPFQWVLVGYSQSYDTVVTVTSDINVFLQALDSLAVDTTNSCLQERYWEGLVHAARNSLERSQVFVFTDQPASNLPSPGTAYNGVLSSFNRETRELERTRLFDIHVLELPNEAGYPYFEHPWPECQLSPAGTRRQDMGFLATSISGHAMKVGQQSRANMLLEMATIITDIIFDRSNTAAMEYKDRVYDTNNRHATDAATREIAVDSTVDFIKIFVSDRGQDNTIVGDLTVERPDGTTVKPLEDSDVVHVNYRASGGYYVQLLIPDPQPGTWKLTRMSPSTVMLADVASAISFTFDFVEWQAEGAHAGWITESGGYFFFPYSWSVRGTKVVTVKARVDGPVGSVDAFHLRTKDSGAIIMAMNLTRVDSLRGSDEDLGDDYVLDQERIYMGFLNTSTFPFCGDFFATVSGTDADGIPFTRRDPSYIESSQSSPNWGRPRSPGCPPPAVPPVLIDISTFPSTSTSTSSTASSATLVPPLTTSTSSSSSSTESSSSSSIASSSAFSIASSTISSLSTGSSGSFGGSSSSFSIVSSSAFSAASSSPSSITSTVSSDSISSDITSIARSSSSFYSSTSESTSPSSFGSVRSSSSSAVISPQASSTSDSWSSMSSEAQITSVSVPPSSSFSAGSTTSMASDQNTSFSDVGSTQSSLRSSSSSMTASSTSISASARSDESHSQSSITSGTVSESSGLSGSSSTISSTVISSLVVSSPSSSVQSVSVSSESSTSPGSSQSRVPSGSSFIPSSSSGHQSGTITATVLSSVVVSSTSSFVQSNSVSSSASPGGSSQSRDPWGSSFIPSSNSDQGSTTPTPSGSTSISSQSASAGFSNSASTASSSGSTSLSTSGLTGSSSGSTGSSTSASTTLLVGSTSLSSSTSTTSQSASTSIFTSGIDSTSTSVDLSSEPPSTTGIASSTEDQSAPSAASSSWSSSGSSGSISGAISITDFTSSTTALPASTSSFFHSLSQTASSSSSTRTRGTCRVKPEKLHKLRSAHALRNRDRIAKPTGLRGAER